jgi:hypothetical protein
MACTTIPNHLNALPIANNKRQKFCDRSITQKSQLKLKLLLSIFIVCIHDFRFP